MGGVPYSGDSQFNLTVVIASGDSTYWLSQHNIEELDLLSSMFESGNISITPRMTDWQGDASCWQDGEEDSWGTIDKAAHHPTVPGWTDQRIHCDW